MGRVGIWVGLLWFNEIQAMYVDVRDYTYVLFYCFKSFSLEYYMSF